MYKGNKGYKYEQISKSYLISKGYHILDTNFLCRFGEIDIIAMYKDILVFVEVKGRKNTLHGYPREYVTENKIKKLVLTAKYYLKTKKIFDKQCRFDVIEVIEDNKKINHIKNIIDVC